MKLKTFSNNNLKKDESTKFRNSSIELSANVTAELRRRGFIIGITMGNVKSIVILA